VTVIERQRGHPISKNLSKNSNWRNGSTFVWKHILIITNPIISLERLQAHYSVSGRSKRIPRRHGFFLFVTFHCYESLRFDWCHYLFCKSYHTNEREMNSYSKLDNIKLIIMLTKVCKVFAQQFIEIMENDNIFCWTENNKQSITKWFFPILTDLLFFFALFFKWVVILNSKT